jgi:hypothetical protein
MCRGSWGKLYDLSVFRFVLALNNNQAQYDYMIFS